MLLGFKFEANILLEIVGDYLNKYVNFSCIQILFIAEYLFLIKILIKKFWVNIIYALNVLKLDSLQCT